MRYVTWIDGAEATVEIVTRDGGRVVARVEVEGSPAREVSLDRHVDAGGRLHVVLPDGRALEGRVSGRQVTLGPHRLDVRAVPERDAWLGAGDAEVDEGAVTVSMPGLVVKVLRQEGDPVQRGEPVLIVEAMKMENEVKAGRAGVVTAVRVRERDPVEAGAVLMEIGDG